MHILFVNQAPIPVFAYGGTERVIWDLGKSLVKLGHRVSYCSVPFCLELKRLFARMTFCRMSRALLVQMNGLG